MIQRILNGLLLLIAAAGLFYTWQTRGQLRLVRAEYDRLSADFGLLEIRDPGKFYVRRIETDDPYDFAWRFYNPDQVSLQTQSSSLSGGGSTSSSSVTARERIARVRFRFTETGLGVFVKCNHGSSTFGIGNRPLSQFLQTHWDDLQIEAIGEEGPIEAGTEEVMTFLSMRIPEPLVEEAKTSLGKSYPRLKNNLLYKLQVGTLEAFQKRREAFKKTEEGNESE